MRILIADDEPLARQKLRRIVADILPQATVLEADNGHRALQLAHGHPVDVALLDIRMPGMDGIEAARHLSGFKPRPAVIFTTAYDAHALDAFSANAIDYLLKPVQAERLEEAISKATALNQMQLHALRDKRAHRHIGGTSGREFLLLSIDDICYLLAEHGYLTAVTAQHRIMVDDTLVRMEQEFPDKLMRVHRNALAGAGHIKSLGKDSSGQWRLHFHDIEDSLAVSRRMLPELKRLLQA